MRCQVARMATLDHQVPLKSVNRTLKKNGSKHYQNRVLRLVPSDKKSAKIVDI